MPSKPSGSVSPSVFSPGDAPGAVTFFGFTYEVGTQGLYVGNGSVNIHFDNGYVESVETPLIVNKTWAEQNRPAAAALTQALKKAADWIYDPANKDKAIEILATYTNVPKDVCADSYKFIVEEQKAIGQGLEVTAAGLDNIIKIDQDIGADPASSKPFDLSRYYDPSYLAAK